MYFHLFVSLSISFIHILNFFEYWSFTSLIRFIPKYFILFDATVNGFVSLTSLSLSSLLVYRNATGSDRKILLNFQYSYCQGIFLNAKILRPASWDQSPYSTRKSPYRVLIVLAHNAGHWGMLSLQVHILINHYHWVNFEISYIKILRFSHLLRLCLFQNMFMFSLNMF